MNTSVERRGRLSTNQRKVLKHNLTGNKYGKYILRQNQENEIIDFLKNESENYQIISGLGGMGKSSLIFSVLSKIISGDIELGKVVDSIIWVTDSYNPGDLDLNKLVDEINAVYGHSSNSSQDDASKTRINTAKQSLNLNGDTIAILVIDNFETVKDEELRRFIFELPQTCKVILTSQINCASCICSGIIRTQNSQCINDFPIQKFDKNEWKNLFETIRDSVNKIDEWANKCNKSQLDQIVYLIYDELGGIPSPFERLLTQIAEKRLYDLSKIQILIRTVITGSGEYDRMILYPWEKLDSKSQAVIIAATLGGYLSTIDFELIASFSGLGSYDENEKAAEIGTDLDTAVSQCVNDKLIEIDMSESIAKYYLPAVVYRFVINKIMNDSDIKIKFSKVFGNWINYYKIRTSRIGMCFKNTEIMSEFDSVSQKEALEFVLDYCYRNSLFEDFITISNNMRYFYYTRSIWCIGDKCVHIKRAKAANKIGDFLAELEAYIYYINIASKYRKFDRVEEYFRRANEIIEANQIRETKPCTFFRYQHTLALYNYHKDNYVLALRIWEGILSEPIITDNIHDIDAAQRWYTKCIIKQVDQSVILDYNINERINSLIIVAKEHNFERAVIDYSLILVRINAQQEHHEKSKEILDDDEIIRLITKTNDALYKAKYYLWCAFYSDGEEKDNYIQTAKKLVDASVIKSILKNDIVLLSEAFGSMFE